MGLVGCAPTWNGCSAVTPSALPTGAATGPIRYVQQPEGLIATWGVGDDQISEAVGWQGVEDRGPADSMSLDSPWRVQVRGNAGFVVPVGDEGAGEIAIVWRQGTCPYTVWLAPPHTVQDAMAYAARF